MSKIKAIIGGFHLVNTEFNLLYQIIKFLKNKGISEVYPCHCTDLNAKIALACADFQVNEISTGMVIDFSR